MKRVFGLLLVMAAIPAAAAQQTASPPAQESPVLAERNAKIEAALTAIDAHKPADALAILDPLLVAYERDYADEKRAIYCSWDTTEMLLYLGAAAAAADKGEAKSAGAIAIDPGWCTALWARGFALIDLERVPEAVPFLERAVSMAPRHAHYLSELGYAYQALRRWDQSLDAYGRAADAAESYEGDRKRSELGRAWRGMGFCYVELGRWDEAEAIYKKALALDPDDAKSKGELEYIAQNRKSRK